MALNVGQLFATLSLNTSQFNSALSSAMVQLKVAGNTSQTSFGQMSTHANIATQAVQGVTVALGGLSVALAGATTFMMKQNSEVEQALISYKYLTGSIEGANKLLEDTKTLAKETPFDFMQINEANLKFLGAGVSATQLKEKIMALADASSVTGANFKENFSGAALAISQMYQKGKVTAEEMNQQLVERGIPGWRAMAIATGKSTEELIQMSKEGKLGRQYIDALFEGMKILYGGASKEQANTFAGITTQIVEGFKTLSLLIGDRAFSNFKEVLSTVNDELTLLAKSPNTLLELKTVVTSIGNVFISVFESIKSGVASINTLTLNNFTASINSVTAVFDGFTRTGFAGDFSNAIVNILSSAIAGFATFADTLATLSTPVVELVNALSGLQTVGQIIGLYYALNIVFSVTSSLVTALITKLYAFSIAQQNAGGILATFKGILSAVNFQSAIYEGLLGKETVAILQKASAEKELASATAFAVLEQERRIAVEKFGNAVFVEGLQTDVAREMGLMQRAAAERAVAVAKLNEAQATGVVNAVKLQELELNAFNTAAEYENSRARLSNTLQAAVEADTISLASAAKIEDAAASSAAASANARLAASNAQTAASFAQLGGRLGQIGIILGVVVGAFAAFDYAITGNTDATKRLFRALGDLVAALGGSFIFVIQGVIVLLAGLALVVMTVALAFAYLIKILTFGKVDWTGSIKEGMGNINDFMVDMGGRMKETMKQINDSALNFGKERIKDEKELTVSEGIVQKEKEAQLQKHQETVIALAKNGQKNYYQELLRGARKGSRAYLEALNEINQEELKAILSTEQKKLSLSMKRLEDARKKLTPLAEKLAGTSVGYEIITERGLPRQFVPTKRQEALIKKGGTIPFAEQLTKDLKPVYREIVNKKDVQDQLTVLTAGLNADIATAQANVDFIKGLLGQSGGGGGGDDAVQKRKDAINNALDKREERRRKELELKNNRELEGIKKFYKNKVDAIEEGIKKLKAANDKAEKDLKRGDLEKEYQFLYYSSDKEAVKRREEIRRELAKMDREEQIAKAEKLAEAQKEALKAQEETAIRAQEEINEKRIESMERHFEVMKSIYEKLAENMKEPLSDILFDIGSMKFEEVGSNFMSRLIAGMKSQKKAFDDVVDEIVRKLNLSNLGDFKDGANLFNQLQAVATASNKGVALNSANTQVILNAPLLNVANMTLADNLDIQTVGTEMWRVLQNTARSDGAVILGRG